MNGSGQPGCPAENPAAAPAKIRWWLWGLMFLLLTAIAFGFFSLWAVRSTRERRQMVAGKVLAGELKPDAAGIIVLPPQFRNLTADGKLYVTRQPGGGTWILFVTWRGKGSSLQGYLYTSPPQFFDIGSGPRAEVVAPPAGLSTIVEVDVESQPRPGWFRVSYSRN